MSPQTPHRLYGKVWDPWVEGRETSCAELCTPLGNCPCPRAQFFGQERHQENWACLQGERSFTLSVLLWGTKAYGPSLSSSSLSFPITYWDSLVMVGRCREWGEGEALLLQWHKKKNCCKISGPWPLCTVSCLSLVGMGGRATANFSHRKALHFTFAKTAVHSC